MKEYSISINQDRHQILNWKIKITAPLPICLQLYYYFPHVFVFLDIYCAPPPYSMHGMGEYSVMRLSSAKQLKVKCSRSSRQF